MCLKDIKNIRANTGHKTFECNVSNNSLSCFSAIENHKARVHNNVQKICSHCGKLFNHAISLRDHIKTVHFNRMSVCDVYRKNVKDFPLHKTEQYGTAIIIFVTNLYRVKLMEMHKAMHLN